MTHPPLSDLLRVATEAARAAGNHARKNESRRREAAQTFKHDIKLILDQESQQQAERVISHHFPTHSILGEESERGEAGAGPQWIIDPIDGTVNFSHGLPYWCSSVAVRIGEQVVAGCVYSPVLGETFTASLDQPSRCNDKPIHVSDVREAAGAIAVTGLEKTFDTHQGTLEITRAVALRVQKIRLMGAAALDICQIAAGRAEAFFESGVYLWDVAAAALIAEQAGGKAELMERIPGGRFRYLITNGHIHDELRGIVVKALELSSAGK